MALNESLGTYLFAAVFVVGLPTVLLVTRMIAG